MPDPLRPTSTSPAGWMRRWRRQFHPARERLQQDPMARLTSAEEVIIAAELGIRIDANQATVDDWLRLPGLSIHQARTLVSLSRGGVSFDCIEDVAAALGLPANALQRLSPVLMFCYYDPASSVSLAPVPLNQATVAQLMALPGMSESLAERILNERRRSPFKNWADAHHRLRFTAEQTSHWMHYLIV